MSAKHVVDVGWVPDNDRGKCRLKRMTSAGNEITLTLIKGRNDPLVTLQFHNGFRMSDGQTVQADVDMLEQSGAGARHGQMLGRIGLMASNNAGETLLFGTFNPGFLRELSNPQWAQMQIGPSEWSEVVNSSGSSVAIDALKRCARSL